MKIAKGSRVVVIGTGFVGSSYAFSLLNQDIVEELVLIDINKGKAAGEAMDISHGLPFCSSMSIWAGDYEDCRDADIVVITAGANQAPGETRLDLTEKNTAIVKAIITAVVDTGFNGIFLVATNPVDVIAYATWKFSNFPRERIIGSGTILDSARLRYLLGEYFQVDSRHIQAYVIGEHGDSALPVWSHVTIGGRPVLRYLTDKGTAKSLDDLDKIFHHVRNAAYQIIERKEATYYAIAISLVTLTKAILQNENAILPVSTLLKGEYQLDDLFIGVPAIINKKGIREVMELDLTDEELEKFHMSAHVLKTAIGRVREL